MRCGQLLLIDIMHHRSPLWSSLAPQNFCQMHESQKGAATHQNTDTTSFCILLSNYQEFCKKLSIE
jgi:hypothetical protein